MFQINFSGHNKIFGVTVRECLPMAAGLGSTPERRTKQAGHCSESHADLHWHVTITSSTPTAQTLNASSGGNSQHQSWKRTTKIRGYNALIATSVYSQTTADLVFHNERRWGRIWGPCAFVREGFPLHRHPAADPCVRWSLHTFPTGSSSPVWRWVGSPAWQRNHALHVMMVWVPCNDNALQLRKMPHPLFIWTLWSKCEAWIKLVQQRLTLSHSTRSCWRLKPRDGKLHQHLYMYLR